jgi:ferric-dicitrate binding protein FerR (iron transport regulator)
MGRVNDDNWLDEALEGALGSDDTQPDFETWKVRHPEAVEQLTTRTPQPQRPPTIRSIKVNRLYLKLAAAAVIAIAGIVGITQLTQPKAMPPEIHFSSGAAMTVSESLTGPTTHTFPDGSIVTLADSAEIRTYGEAGKRGFKHVSGVIDVTVAKGKGEFVVTTPYGDVKVLGTEFTLELVDGTADGGEKVEMLAVEVTEGKVEVSNDKGTTTLEASQDTIVEKDAAPYDFNQDEALPDRLKERIQAMLDAFAAGDAAAWAANFNMNYVFKLAKGQVEYDPLRFGGSQEDAERLQGMLKDIESVEQMAQAFRGSVNISEPIKIYVRAVELSVDGAHARAQCVRRKTERNMTITTPQWHHFDNDWWQIDD